MSETGRWSGESIYSRWAPEGAAWSPWVKPVIFAEMRDLDAPPPIPREIDRADVSWAPEPTIEKVSGDDAGYRAAATRERAPAPDRAAIVVDLPGAESAIVGLALARRGYRPVPLYNGTSGGWRPSRVTDIAAAIAAGVRVLETCSLEDDAPPAFLLDRDRATGVPRPGAFDGRWLVFPQDFPSANALRARGIERVIWRAQEGVVGDDLAHVLLDWKRQGIALESCLPGGSPTELSITEPSGFRSLLRRAAVIMGLRRSSAGGFGGMIPLPSQGGG